jgi:hypothetical protein
VIGTQLVVALAVASSACITPEQGIRATAAVDAAMFACDYAQTMAVSHDGRWDVTEREGDPLLGHEPSAMRLTTTLVGNLAITALAALAPMPRWMRATALGFIAGDETRTLASNWKYEPRCGL